VAVTYAQFVQEFSQFNDPERRFKVEQALAQAARKVGPAYGDVQDDGIKLWAAHLLSSDPMAETAAFATGQNGAIHFGSSRYKVLFDDLLKGARVGFFGTTSG
jgi:hypothetical protein